MSICRFIVVHVYFTKGTICGWVLLQPSWLTAIRFNIFCVFLCLLMYMDCTFFTSEPLNAVPVCCDFLNLGWALSQYVIPIYHTVYNIYNVLIHCFIDKLENYNVCVDIAFGGLWVEKVMYVPVTCMKLVFADLGWQVHACFHLSWMC